tara:strand:+ start:11507 stop:13669 length:2163 start_codon:yes stop_codon:yes gene_type:complete
MAVYSIDFETYSEADLRSYGAYRYASDPSTEILLCAIARHGEAPLLWSVTGQPEKPKALALIKEMCEDPEAVIYAHNAQFEASICHYLWEKTFDLPCPKLEQWRCTAAMARRAAIPSSLEQAADFLKLDAQKDNLGKSLIRLFSIPQKPTKKQPNTRVFPKDEPEKFREFGQYCKQDVIVEMQVHDKLKAFELKGEVLAGFQFDMKMNHLGVPVNVEALEIAEKLVDEYDTKIVEGFQEMTGLKPTQRSKVLEWLQERGFPGKDLTAPTVDQVIADGGEAYGMTPEAFAALKMKRLSGFAALKKIPTMLNAACPDHRVKGSLMWSGAERTHRWAGRIIQPQNFRRPTIANTEHLYRVLKSGNMDVESLELIYESPLEAIASCIRHFIEPEEVFEIDSFGKGMEPGMFLDADYSAIEARIVLWLAGQEEGLQLFRDKKDPYIAMASKIFGVPVEDITKDQRFVGKQSVLGAGYGMGPDKFKMTAAQFGRTLTQEISEKAISTFRTVNHKIPAMWRAFDNAAKEAIRNPGQVFPANDKVKFAVTNKPGFTALVMQLPSGHNLIYPKPKLLPVWVVFYAGKMNKFKTPKAAEKFCAPIAKRYKEQNLTLPANKQKEAPEPKEDVEITFWGKRLGRWLRVGTYGGSLVENATQAVAGDLMSHGALKADSLGYKIFMLVHDQALAELQPGNTIEEFCEALCTLPPWAEGLPLEAEGGLVPFYKKD